MDKIKLTIIALAATFSLSGASAFAQTSREGTVGGPAARQETGDPLIRKPTSEEVVTDGSPGVTTGNSTHNLNGNPDPRPKEPDVGGPASSKQGVGTIGAKRTRLSSNLEED
jgi:hypothetical protein